MLNKWKIPGLILGPDIVFWVLSQTVSGVKNVTNQTCGAACLGLQPLVNKKVAESNVFIKLKVSQSPLYTYNYCTHRVFGS